MQNTVFSKQWFEDKQGTLLWLLNNAYTKRWFRWVMRIRKHDCPLSTTINKIAPNSFSYNGKWIDDERIEITTDFRTHDKYAKRLYYAFRPLWYLFHFIDWSAFDRYEALAKLSFGFTTLTQYPGTTSADNPVDGRIQRDGVDQTWAAIQAGAGVTVNYTEASGACVSLIGSTTSNQYKQMGRSIYCYDTSSIDDTAIISAATMYIWKISSLTGLGVNEAVLTQLATPANTNALVVADFDNIETIATDDQMYLYGSGTQWTNDQYNDCSSVTQSWRAGFSDINKTGITKFGMRFLKDGGGGTTYTWGSNAEHSVTVYFANQTGTTNDPKLVVTYTTVVPDTSSFFNFI